MQNLLAVDLGASSGRVIRAAYSGDTLSVQEVRRFKNQPIYLHDRMCWNIYSIFQEIKWGILAATASHGEISSLAIDSWAVDFGLIDANGCLLDLPRHYRDVRNGSAMKDVLARVGESDIYERTGIQLQPFNTIYQLYAMQNQNGNLLNAADTLLLIPDLLNYFLSGEKSAEFTNATTTQLLSAETRNWDSALLSKLNLPSRLLPDIAEPGTVAGLLRDDELIQTQSLQSLKIIRTASHDTASAVVSVPNQSANYAYISSGTWSLLGTVVPEPLINEKTEAFNFTNEGGLGNYRLLKNVMGLWLVQETQRALQSIGESYEIEWLVHEANLARPFGFMFDPDDPRLLQPGHFPETIHQICRETGQLSPNNTGALVRGIFESLALKYRYVLEQLETLTGNSYDAIHIIGGGSQNQLLSQFTANATNRIVITGPVEASAMGNVLVQLFALGEIKSASEMTELILRSVETVTYLPRDTATWDESYSKFKSIIDLQEMGRLH